MLFCIIGRWIVESVECDKNISSPQEQNSKSLIMCSNLVGVAYLYLFVEVQVQMRTYWFLGEPAFLCLKKRGPPCCRAEQVELDLEIPFDLFSSHNLPII